MKSEGEGSKEEVFLIITHSWESLYSSIWYEYQFSLWLYTQFFHFSTNSVFSAKLKTIICTFITYWGPAMLSTLSGTRYSAANTKRAWFLNLSYERKHNNQIIKAWRKRSHGQEKPCWSGMATSHPSGLRCSRKVWAAEEQRGQLFFFLKPWTRKRMLHSR